MRSVSLAAGVAAALGSASALAAPPTTPADLRVDVYSGTAAELFWSRSSDPDGAVSRYEIRRDGELVDTRDGLSHFTDDLTDGRAFAFTVTAVDFDGERSAPAALSVVGGDRSGATGSGGGRPTPPANLTSRVYSSSAAEVFWDRSDQRGLSYEVSVDGGPVTTTSGTSAFLSGLDGARGRGVDVVAIDRNGRRSGAANVTLGGGGGNPDPPSGNGNGEAPAAPSGLRGDLYSPSAGEVFWDRVIGANLSYEVSIDGEVVATTDGTSYFVDGLEDGVGDTRVEVVAIGSDGARSDASGFLLAMGPVPIDPDPDPGPGTDAPPAPANARIEVYSGTAAELFFDRAPPSANVVETEIVRDGETLGTTSGTSLFDPNRTPGRSYAYELVAVNASGARSTPSTVGDASVPDTPAPDPAPVFGLISGRPVAVVADYAERPFVNGSPERDSLGDFTLVETVREADGFPVRVRFACSGGGEYEKPAFPRTGQGGLDERVFSDCAIGGFVYDGALRTSGSTVSIEDFSVAASGGTTDGDDDPSTLGIVLIADGSVTAGFTTSGNVRRSTWRFDVYEADASLTDSTVADVRDDRTSPPTDRLEVDLTVAASWTDGETLSGSNDGSPFAGRGSAGFYTVGRLVLESDDGGTRIELDADSGDETTYLWTVERDGGVSGEILSWEALLDGCAESGAILGVPFELSLCASR